MSDITFESSPGRNTARQETPNPTFLHAAKSEVESKVPNQNEGQVHVVVTGFSVSLIRKSIMHLSGDIGTINHSNTLAALGTRHTLATSASQPFMARCKFIAARHLSYKQTEHQDCHLSKPHPNILACCTAPWTKIVGWR
jgi:hypothetical protein